MFKILSLAGGGLRGAFAIGLLAELESRLDTPLTDHFDLIAGTSTGAITAASLAAGIPAAGVREFYRKHSDQIFHPRDPLIPRAALRPIYPAARSLVKSRLGRNLDDFFQSRYCPFRLHDSMVEGFGDRTMGDAQSCPLIIPAVNLTEGETCVFRTPHLPGDRPEADWPIADIIVAATAAPTYFPHKTMPDGQDYADGGLWANNPGVVAMSEASRMIAAGVVDPQTATTIADVRMLSIGTGRPHYSMSPPGADAGMLFWARHVADVMSVSQSQGNQLPLSILLGDRYQHVDFDLPDATWTLDNISMTEPLFEMGRERGIGLWPVIRASLA